MHFRHRPPPIAHRIVRRIPVLRSLPLASVILVLLWIYTLYVGERTTFFSHIEACEWHAWEAWPVEASPHHLVFVADPQLVDPHTYPGRPWPLDVVTERYTDRYMRRNFRLINDKLDPDSIIFLGDLFDGGREWATKQVNPLLADFMSDANEAQSEAAEAANSKSTSEKSTRSWEEPDTQSSELSEKPRLVRFRYGENGRWARWNMAQWYSEYLRFSNIFLSPEQLYPGTRRTFSATSTVQPDTVGIMNGAQNITRNEYATFGSKQRQLFTSLPGNHDLGFGAGVQLPVRDRHSAYFGQTNDVYVLGNHTFVSIDTPSLSAYSEFTDAGETDSLRRRLLQDIWKPTHGFLEGLKTAAEEVVSRELKGYFSPGQSFANDAHQAIDISKPSMLGVRDSALDRADRFTISETNAESRTDTAALSSMSAPGQRPSSVKPATTDASIASLPVILLSHIPLFRNPDTDCGVLRERGKAIHVAAGYQYQNVLTQSLSTLLVQKIRHAAGEIVHAFSGDDHDYCDILHRVNVGMENLPGRAQWETFREVTVKSFSWAMGVRRPGFQLVSLWNPIDETGRTVSTLPTIQTELCLLPDQLSIFIIYGMLCGFTLFVLIVRAVIIGVSHSPRNMNDGGLINFVLPRRELEKAQFRSDRKAYYRSSTPGQSRHRASSTSASTNTNQSTPNNIGVQRSYNARTRSVSPGIPIGTTKSTAKLEHNSPASFMTNTGYHSAATEEIFVTDVESQYGDDNSPGHDGRSWDSQAKWKRRSWTSSISRPRKAVSELCWSLMLVAIPSGMFYAWLMANE